MATNFPDTSVNNPSTGVLWAEGDSFSDPETGLTYYWYPPVWKTGFSPTGATDDKYVEVAGDNMTGPLTLGPEGGPAEITLDASSGLIQTGGNAGFDPGVNLSQIGNVTVTRASNGEVFRVNRMGTSTPTSVIDASGDAEFTGDVQMASQNGGPLAGFRNQIINGDFRIWQRGYDITVPLEGVTDGAAYTADRWITGQGNVRVRGGTPSASLPDFGWSLLFDGQREYDYIAQPIELTRTGRLEPFFPGTTWTFSIYHDGNPDDFTFRAYFGDKGIGSTTVDEVVPFGTALTPLGNSRYSHTFTIPSDQTINAAATNFRVELASKTGAVVTGVRLTGVQLEPGPVATPFEHRPIGIELALCQRYYQTCGGAVLYQYKVESSGRHYKGFHMVRTVEMRTNPNIETTISSGFTLAGNSTMWHAYAVTSDNTITIEALDLTAAAEL